PHRRHDPRQTSPYYPQSNGKIERWHKTLNTARLHSAIGYITPQDKLDGREHAIFDARDRKLADARDRRATPRQEQRDRQCQPTVTPPRPAIDFDAVKAAITIAAVLQLLGCSLHGRGPQQRGPCPLHGSTFGTSRCFSAHLDRNAFHCFKCGRCGNALDLWVAATRQTPYDAAVELCNRLAIPLPTLANNRNREEEPWLRDNRQVQCHRPDDASGIQPINPTELFFQFTLNHSMLIGTSVLP